MIRLIRVDLRQFLPRAVRLSRIKAVFAPQARASRAPANKQAGRNKNKGRKTRLDWIKLN